MTEETEPEVEYQIGAHDVDTEKVQTGDSDEEFIEFQMESKAVFKRLATDIYESEEAGIREPLTNASTAVLRAQEEFGLSSTQGVIEISLHRDSDGLQLVIQDNGTGITDAELREVLAVIGRSTNRNREDLSGQFGMGFLALWMLSGLDGGFIMHTHSRKDGSEPVSGIWKSGGFSRVSPDTFENSLTDDHYGTRLEISLKKNIDGNDIRDWVSKYAEWCRVPVVYREFDADGQDIFNEDYGDKKLESDIAEDAVKLVVESEHFRAVCSNDATGRAVLLDVPVSRNNRYIRGMPFSEVDIRMKKESGVVVDGPHEGLIPVSENEYREKDDTTKYIPTERLTSQDVVMPGPTGTRDKLATNDDFWNWLGDQFWEVYNEEVTEYFKRLDSRDDLFDLDQTELLHVIHASQEIQDYNTPFEQKLPSRLGVSISGTVAESIRALRENVEVAPRGKDPSTASNRTDTMAAKVAWQANGNGNDGTVFMGVSLNKQKSNIAWEDDDDNIVVRVDSTEEYEKYQKLGWRKLKEIKKSNIEEFDISKSTKEEFVGENANSGVSAINNPDSRKLTLHFNSRRTTNKKATAKNIKDQFEEYYEKNGSIPSFGHRNPKRLLMFPNNSDRSLSDHYWITNERTAIATCAVSVWEYLSDVEGIYHIDDYIKQAESTEIKTTEGKMTVSELPDNAAVHIVADDALDLFKDDTVMNRVAEYFVSDVFDGGYSTPDLDSVVYAPITQEKYNTIRPALRGNCVVTGDTGMADVGNLQSIMNDVQPYAYARLYEWTGTPEMNRLTNISANLDNGGYDLVETLGQLHDAGIDPNSINSEHSLSDD